MSINRSILALSAITLILFVPGSASATTGADIRVVTADGRELADVRQYTDTANIPSSPSAKCFFGGAGGSGKPKTIQGPTALGAVVDAAASVPSLNPILVTDEFSFGLGVCGFGGISSEASNFWQVRVNHYALQVGGDQVFLGGGDDVLWTLVPAPECDPSPPFACKPTIPELRLEVPARVRPGQPFGVRVVEYSDTGVAAPAAGVTVTGATQPTDVTGATTVTLQSSTTLVGTRANAIPSQQLRVCVSTKPRRCAGRHGRAIFGSDREDAIAATKGPDRIKARGDDDTIRVRGGDRDTVDCGGGQDLVSADRFDKVTRRSCETVLRPKARKKGKKK